MPRITKVITHLGDRGETYLANKEKVSKSSRRIKACGEVDELNSVVGICKSIAQNSEIKDILKTIQGHLFLLGAELSHPKPPDEYPKIENRHLKYVEEICEKLNVQLSPLKEFILPTGNLLSSFLHFARTVSRRSERAVVHLHEKTRLRNIILKYINRVSDLFFIMARYVNKFENIQDEQIDFKKLYGE